MNYIHQIEPYITEVEKEAAQEYLTSKGWLTEHKITRQFEELIESITDAKYAVAVPNGTIGLYLSTLATLEAESYVVVPAYTMVASINALIWANMIPVVVDIDPATGCLDIDKIPNNIEVQGVLYVPINGRTGDMRKVVEWCAVRNAVLIEDACQAFMSSSDYRMCGTFGKIGAYSFSPHKIITTGQGGVIVTNDDRCYQLIRRLKDFGRDIPGTDAHQTFGLNFKFTDWQALIGIQQMSNIALRIRKKLELFSRYQEALPANMQMLPLEPGNVPWFIDVLCENEQMRNELEAYLKSKNIGTRRFYSAMGQHSYIQRSVARKEIVINDTPEAEKFSARGLWLPSSIGLNAEQIEYIISTILAFK